MKILLAICLLITARLNAQSFLNGSFENNSYTSCEINSSNSSYNLFMSHSHAFGTYNTIDILDSTCNYGFAENGNWFLWLGTNFAASTYDAISLELDNPLVIGNTYKITYYDKSFFGSSIGSDILHIGYSYNDSTFGTPIYISPLPSVGIWTQRSFNFTAVDTSSFITVKSIPSNSAAGWGQTQIDNFEISIVIGINENLNQNNIIFYPNPTSKFVNINFDERYKSLTVQIINLFGQVIYEETFSNSKELHLLLPELPNGSYIAKIHTDKNAFIYNFIIQN